MVDCTVITTAVHCDHSDHPDIKLDSMVVVRVDSFRLGGEVHFSAVKAFTAPEVFRAAPTFL